MSLQDSKNSYGAVDDLETGVKTSHVKDAGHAADGPRRFAVIAAVGVFGLLGFVSAMPTSSRSSAPASLYTYDGGYGQIGQIMGEKYGQMGRNMGRKYGQMGQEMGQKYGQMGQDIGQQYAEMGEGIGQYYRDKYAGGGGHGGNTKSSGDTVINNGKYKKACKVNGGNFQDAVNWSATVNGKTIKNYCPWVHEQKNPGTYCKQKQNNVLVSTACPCACAGY